jgi:hypothetical protein
MSKIYKISVISALAGFLFVFDPGITTVSNPNKNPANAEITEIL